MIRGNLLRGIASFSKVIFLTRDLDISYYTQIYVLIFNPNRIISEHGIQIRLSCRLVAILLTKPNCGLILKHLLDLKIKLAVPFCSRFQSEIPMALPLSEIGIQLKTRQSGRNGGYQWHLRQKSKF